MVSVTVTVVSPLRVGLTLVWTKTATLDSSRENDQQQIKLHCFFPKRETNSNHPGYINIGGSRFVSNVATHNKQLGPDLHRDQVEELYLKIQFMIMTMGNTEWVIMGLQSYSELWVQV